MKELRCIVIGIGGIGKVTVRHLAGQSWFQPVALVDVNPQALADGRELVTAVST